jgi:hypothetical protein
MVTNTETMIIENTTTADVVQDVEYAITDLLLKSLFAQCAAYFGGTKKRQLSVQRRLASGQVIGISAQPDDIITGGELYSNPIFMSNFQQSPSDGHRCKPFCREL